jgi:hypothetical protein
MAYRIGRFGRRPFRRFRRRTNYRRARRAPYRRRYTRMRRMTRRRPTVRRVRDLAARKCEDNLIATPIDNTGAAQTPGSTNMTAANQYMYIFSPTARTAGYVTDAGDRVLTASSSERRKTKCFVRGYKETMEMQTTDASVWVWRRIVFSTIGLAEQFSPELLYFRDDVRGYARTTFDLNSGTVEADQYQGMVYGRLFDGLEGVDWSSPFTAKTNPQEVRVYSDRTTTLQSPNSDRGTYRNYKNWYPINRSIIYNDDEAGDAAKASNTVAKGTPYGNMGDLFVVDFFRSVGPDTAGLQIVPHGKYYWHEGQSS